MTRFKRISRKLHQIIEHLYLRDRYPDFYALGQDIRERYTVRSEAGK